MRKPLALTATFAWILIQVPLVFCDTGCGPALASILTLEGHDCHDEASVAHQTRCGHGCDHTHAAPKAPETHPDGRGPNGTEGDHVIVQVQVAPGGLPTALPAPAPTRTLATALLLNVDATQTTPTNGDCIGRTRVPPRPVVPVLRVTQLLL